jgi:hypothetical protein
MNEIKTRKYLLKVKIQWSRHYLLTPPSQTHELYLLVLISMCMGYCNAKRRKKSSGTTQYLHHSIEEKAVGNYDYLRRLTNKTRMFHCEEQRRLLISSWMHFLHYWFLFRMVVAGHCHCDIQFLFERWSKHFLI